MTVANFTTAYATLSLGFTRRERWEVVVEEETLIVLVQYIVNELLVELGSERTGRER